MQVMVAMIPFSPSSTKSGLELESELEFYTILADFPEYIIL